MFFDNPIRGAFVHRRAPRQKKASNSTIDTMFSNVNGLVFCCCTWRGLLSIRTPDAHHTQVLQGEVKETRYSIARGNSLDGGNGRPINVQQDGRRLLETSAYVFGAGTVSYIEDSMGYHKMENTSLTEESISLHLYSPGITECTTWADTASATCVGFVVCVGEVGGGRGGVFCFVKSIVESCLCTRGCAGT